MLPDSTLLLLPVKDVYFCVVVKVLLLSCTVKVMYVYPATLPGGVTLPVQQQPRLPTAVSALLEVSPAPSADWLDCRGRLKGGQQCLRINQ